jgi:prepilin-type N-terminal cleavage/methylation domain-containing protein
MGARRGERGFTLSEMMMVVAIVAVTLILGILASMVTAIFVTRTFFNFYVQRRPGLQA